MSQASTLAASSQPDSLSQAPTPARADPPDARFPAVPQSLEPLCRTSLHRCSRLRLLRLVGPHTVVTHQRRPPRRSWGFLRLFTSRILTLLRVHALQLFSRAWLLLFCLTPRPPPPVPVFSPFRDGHYWCSKCPRRGFTTIPGLMRHVTHQHAGSSVDEATCSLFAAIERVTCTAPSCGGLRRMGARICNRCGQASQARPPRVGDVIMGPLGAPSSSEDVVMADTEAPVTPSLTVDLSLVDLPTGFTQRIRALPSSTILHVPASCRLRMISAVARCWNGMAQGRDDYAQLEEGRSKLLLSTVPQGLSVATEVQKRLTLWEERSFEALLQRAEEQFLLKRKAGSGGKPVVRLTPLSGVTARDALQVLAPTGKPPLGSFPPCSLFLNRRTRAGLKSSFLPPPLVRPPTVILTWLPLLLCQSPPGTGHSQACIMPLSLLQARLEHAQSTSQICSMSRAGFMPTRSMLPFSALFCKISAGSLPPAARWLTRTRLCWQHKKNGNRVLSRWVSSFALPTPSAW